MTSSLAPRARPTSDLAPTVTMPSEQEPAASSLCVRQKHEPLVLLHKWISALLPPPFLITHLFFTPSVRAATVGHDTCTGPCAVHMFILLCILLRVRVSFLNLRLCYLKVPLVFSYLLVYGACKRPRFTSRSSRPFQGRYGGRTTDNVIVLLRMAVTR